MNSYFNRILNDHAAKLIKTGGSLSWLIDYLKRRNDLDFQTGSDNKGQSWISIYRGTSRILSIKVSKTGKINTDAAEAYKKLMPGLYKDVNSISADNIDQLVKKIEKQYNREFNLRRFFKHFVLKNPDFEVASVLAFCW